jgi:hypothetical protein
MKITEVKDTEGNLIGTIDRTNEYIAEACREENTKKRVNQILIQVVEHYSRGENNNV